MSPGKRTFFLARGERGCDVLRSNANIRELAKENIDFRRAIPMNEHSQVALMSLCENVSP